jgi:hypothetical protein
MHARSAKPGIAVSADCGSISEDECFLCQAPDPTSKCSDFDDAWMVGVVEGVLAMTGSPRKPLCPRHETSLRELLVLYVQEVDTFKKLGIEARRGDGGPTKAFPSFD